jgi:hypothetical protein
MTSLGSSSSRHQQQQLLPTQLMMAVAVAVGSWWDHLDRRLLMWRGQAVGLITLIW